MKSIYLETSALLAAAFHEPNRQLVLDRLSGAFRVVASWLVRVEAERALHRITLGRSDLERQVPDIRRELNSFWSRVDLIEMDAEICDLACRIAPASRLRSLDAIHLATFRRLREITPTLEMLSFDRRILAEVMQG